MTTVGERLVTISGLSGISVSSALQSIGSGGTVGELLISWSGLSTGTVAQHLLAGGGIQPRNDWRTRIIRRRRE